jgi:hypothetical protein
LNREISASLVAPASGESTEIEASTSFVNAFSFAKKTRQNQTKVQVDIRSISLCQRLLLNKSQLPFKPAFPFICDTPLFKNRGHPVHQRSPESQQNAMRQGKAGGFLQDGEHRPRAGYPDSQSLRQEMA